MNNSPDWRQELERTKKELGSPLLIAAYWAGVAVVLFFVSLAIGQGVPGVFNIIIIIIAAAPFALGLNWLTSRKKAS